MIKPNKTIFGMDTVQKRKTATRLLGKPR